MAATITWCAYLVSVKGDFLPPFRRLPPPAHSECESHKDCTTGTFCSTTYHRRFTGGELGPRYILWAPAPPGIQTCRPCFTCDQVIRGRHTSDLTARQTACDSCHLHIRTSVDGRCDVCPLAPCLKKLEAMKGEVAIVGGPSKPQCAVDGLFEKRQCQGAICWEVDQATGEALKTCRAHSVEMRDIAKYCCGASKQLCRGGGMPGSCSEGCQQVFQDYFNRCEGVMRKTRAPSIVQQLVTFREKCATSVLTNQRICRAYGRCSSGRNSSCHDITEAVAIMCASKTAYHPSVLKADAASRYMPPPRRVHHFTRSCVNCHNDEAYQCIAKAVNRDPRCINAAKTKFRCKCTPTPAEGGKKSPNGRHDNPHTETRRECFDYKDNDGDGKSDCEDSDCTRDRRIRQRCQQYVFNKKPCTSRQEYYANAWATRSATFRTQSHCDRITVLLRSCTLKATGTKFSCNGMLKAQTRPLACSASQEAVAKGWATNPVYRQSYDCHSINAALGTCLLNATGTTFCIWQDQLGEVGGH